MNTGPLVSVIIPTFNRCSVLGRAIESALKQDYQNLEILIINDASGDSTETVVKSFDDPRIKYVLHEKNRGLAAARNTGIRNSSGEYITFLDDDDEWGYRKVRRQVQTFNHLDPKPGLIFTNGFSEYENGLIIRNKQGSGIAFDPGRDRFFPLRVLVSPPSSWMIPKAVVADIGFFDEEMFNNWDDGDYLVRVSFKYQTYFLNENLVIWHALANHVNMINEKLIRGKEVFLRKNLDAMKNDASYLFRFYRAMGKDTLKLDKKKARAFLLKAFRMRPLDLSTIGKLSKTL